jgi:hypothetical protein
VSEQPNASAAKAGSRLALIRARSGVDVRWVLLLPFGAIAYAYVALGAELLGQSPTAVALLTVLATLCASGFLLRPTSDRLDLFRVFSFYYLMVFCIGPIFEPAFSFYVHDDPKPALLVRTAALALFGYLSIAFGYHLPFFRSAPKVVHARHDEYNRSVATAVGLALFVVGAISFVIMFFLAGGAAVILRGEGGLARTEFSFGLGWYYWLSLFMVPGGALYFAAQASRRGLFAWLHGWPLVTAFLFLMLLQGRHRAMGPILIMFAISHYLIRRIRLPRLALYATAGMALAVVMNTARSPALRGTFASDPVGFTAAVLRNFPEEAKDEMAGGIGRIDEVMIVVDHVPDRMPYDLGHSLTAPLNPFFRLAGRDDLQARMVGERLYEISRPDMAGSPYRTGFLPSIVGEMRANFPTLLCFIPFALFGALLRLVYQRLVLHRADYISIAAYAILGLFLCSSVFGAIAQIFFEMVVVATPIFLVRFAAQRTGGGRRPHFESATPTAQTS